MNKPKKRRKPKLRIPIAPPSQRHKTEKDYDRNKEKQQTKEEVSQIEPEKESPC